MNELQIFKNHKFGAIRAIDKGGEPWFVAVDVCRALDIGNPTQALTRLDDDEVTLISNEGGREVNFINEPGLYSLVLGSRKPEAKAFKRWITHEVIPSIRKTGTYSASGNQSVVDKSALTEAKLNNSRARLASVWVKLANMNPIPEYKQICASHASAVLAGHEVIPLPEAKERTYSAEEVGAMLGGISANKIGRIANQHGLKSPEYGVEVWDKSKHSAKQVPAWRYNDKAVERFREIITNV